MAHTFSPVVLATIRGPIVTCPVRAAEILVMLRAAASGRSASLDSTVTRYADYPAFVADWDAMIASDGAVD